MPVLQLLNWLFSRLCSLALRLVDDDLSGRFSAPFLFASATRAISGVLRDAAKWPIMPMDGL